jgi:hypothetical protein
MCHVPACSSLFSGPHAPSRQPRDVSAHAIVTLSTEAQECLYEARQQAAGMGSAAVQPGHVLLGCLIRGEAAATFSRSSAHPEDCNNTGPSPEVSLEPLRGAFQSD